MIFDPNPKQDEFLSATERYVAYGGARGGGKSYAARTKAALLVIGYNGITILILRRSYPELTQNHITPLRDMLEPAGATYSEKDKTLFVGRSRIIFGYCDNDNALRRYQGNEYDVIIIDEATQFEWSWFDKLKACVRGANNYPKHIFLTCNPGDIGHAWVKRLFIDRDFRAGEDPADYRFIKATVYDNAVLMENDPEYVKNLESLSEGLRAAWLYGSWDVFEGQYFTEWDASVHVIKPFDVPQSWRYYLAMDYGLDMLAAYVIAVDPQERAYVVREHYQSGLIISAAADAVRELTAGLDVYQYFAPPDLWNRNRDTGKSAAEVFGEHGITLCKTDNDRVNGWLEVHERLKVTTDEQGGRSAGLRVFDTCKNLIRCLPMLCYDERHPKDCATEPHEITHAPDAIRYFCAGRPYAAPEPTRKKDVLPPALRDDVPYTNGVIDW